MEPVVLEEWLLAASSSVLSSPPAQAPPASSQSTPADFAASSIVHAWAQIRSCVQQQKALTPSDIEAFDVLNQHRRSLHFAESQAKLLLAVLTELSSSDPALLAFVRRFAVLGLLAWARKSFTSAGSNANSGKQAPETLASVVRVTRKTLEERPLADGYVCEAILLLGTISTLQFVSADVRSDCLTTIATQLEECRNGIVGGTIAEALAGAGLALSVSSQEHLAPIMRGLLLLWAPSPQFHAVAEAPAAEGDQRLGGELEARQKSRGEEGCPNLKDIIMLLHLMDYFGALFFARQRNSQPASSLQLEFIHDSLITVIEDHNFDSAVQCSIIMASAGLLRSLYRWDEGNKKHGISTIVSSKWVAIMRNLEDHVIKITQQAVAPDAFTFQAGGPLSCAGVVPLQAGTRQLCRCVSVAVSRCRGLPAHPCLLQCLLISIFGDSLYIDELYSALTAEQVVGRAGVSQEQPGESSSQDEKSGGQGSSFDGIRVHIESDFFQEMGALARAMCDQYMVATGDLQGQTEHLISEYARNLYAKHRRLVATSPTPLGDQWPQYGQTLEKVLEAAFITVVIFFSFAIGEYVPDENSSEARLAALALDSLACVEYFRHVQLREFSKLIHRCVFHISGSKSASVSFAGLLPTYQDIVQGPGALDLYLPYSWNRDEVQTARILFSFRVMSMSLSKMPAETFASKVAPLIYMQHPLETVTKASHALFAAFLSLSEGSELDMRLLDSNGSQKFATAGSETKPVMTLREQLVVFYMERALQTFPAVTPFQGLVVGVGAIAHQLPSGSPATVYCLNCLVDKAASLYHTDVKSGNIKELESDVPLKDLPGQNIDQHKLPVEQIRAAQKLQILLLQLILLVDLQVLPVLLKLMAKLILGLPQQFRTAAMVEAFDVVGGSDDYTRKPILVSWLQSLSFLVSNGQDLSSTKDPLEEKCSSETGRSMSVPSSSRDSASSLEGSNEGRPLEVRSSTCATERNVDLFETVAQDTLEDEQPGSSLEIATETENVSPNFEKDLEYVLEEGIEDQDQDLTNLDPQVVLPMSRL